MRFKFKVLLFLALPVVILDQWTKLLVLKKIPYGEHISVISGFFDLVHVRNPGAAFGLFSNASASLRVPFFYTISILALIFLAYYFYKLRDEESWSLVIVSLLFGGVIGNMIDRIRFGNVVDFLSCYIGEHAWPAFNVADSAITVAMGCLILQTFLERKKS